MRRRAALSALFALGPGAGAAPAWDGGAGDAGASTPTGVLVWGPTGLWVGQRGGVLQALPGHGVASPLRVPPVPVVGGLWALRDERRLVGWQSDLQGAWTVAAVHDVEETVHALAASADGRFVLAAHGERLSLLDARGALVRRYEGSDLERRRRGRAGSLVHLSGRRSFVVAWPDLGELWEISLDPAAGPLFDGLVHDYRMGEAIATPGYLGVRRAPLGVPMPEIGFADGRVPWVAGLLGEQVQVVHLDVRRRVAQWRLPGAAPHAGLLRRVADAWAWWLPVDDSVQVLDTARWQPVARHGAPGVVRVLQGQGDAVWALCGEGPAARLVVWRGTAWERVELPAGAPFALHADASGRQLLVATADPPRLHVLDGEGHPRHAWTLPTDSGGPREVRWLPGAA